MNKTICDRCGKEFKDIFYLKEVKMILIEFVKDIKSAKEFLELNKIKPKGIIVIWEEDIK